MHKNIKRLNIKTHKKFENDFEIKNIVKHATCQCVLYILTSVWSPQHPNAGREMKRNEGMNWSRVALFKVLRPLPNR